MQLKLEEKAARISTAALFFLDGCIIKHDSNTSSLLGWEIHRQEQVNKGEDIHVVVKHVLNYKDSSGRREVNCHPPWNNVRLSGAAQQPLRINHSDMKTDFFHLASQFPFCLYNTNLLENKCPHVYFLVFLFLHHSSYLFVL